jgi:hypothetical protein
MSEEATTTRRIFTPEEIEARVEVIKQVRNSWKGKSDYALQIDMEIWALSTMASLIRSARVHAEVMCFSAETRELAAQDMLENPQDWDLFK